MTEKVKIGETIIIGQGEYEYRLPFKVSWRGREIIINDGDDRYVDIVNAVDGLNELSQLRQENKDLKKRVEELEEWKNGVLCQDCGSINCWPDGEYTPDEEGK